MGLSVLLMTNTINQHIGLNYSITVTFRHIKLWNTITTTYRTLVTQNTREQLKTHKTDSIHILATRAITKV